MTAELINSLVSKVQQYGLPNEQILWVDLESYNKWNNYIKNLGSGNSFIATVPCTETECVAFKMNNITFYILQY